LKLANSNLVYKLAWGVDYQETTLGLKFAGVRARGASEKKLGNWDPVLISATVEASNFIFGIQLGLGE